MKTSLILALCLIPNVAFAQSQNQLIAKRFHQHMSSTLSIKVATNIENLSDYYGVDRALILAVIFTESGFNPRATSITNAKGLMQVEPKTGHYVADMVGIKWRGSEALYEPIYNLKLGVAYLAYLLRVFHQNVVLALTAYNMGPSNLRRRLRHKALRANHMQYASKIMAYWFYYERILAGPKEDICR